MRKAAAATSGPTLADIERMVLGDRDWLLLRARLRRFVSLAALPAMTMMGEAAASASEVDPLAETRENAAVGSAAVPAGEVANDVDAELEAVQCNPFGDEPTATPSRNASAAATFARDFAKEHPRATLIGMPSIASQADADRVRDLLERETKTPWKVRWFNKRAALHLPSTSGDAIFWRADALDVVEDFGSKEVLAIGEGAAREGRSVRFAGILFQRKGSARRLAAFTGRLAAWSTGEGVREQAHQIAQLRGWMQEKLRRHESASRALLLSTMNAAA